MLGQLSHFTEHTDPALKGSTRVMALLAIVAGAVGLLALIKLGYGLPWTGFGPSLDPTGAPVAPKSLWDWLDLLIVPVVLALGAWLLDGSRKRSERLIEEERQRQHTLEQYFDFMTPLLSDAKLSLDGVDSVRSLARTRTLAVLRLLDGGRKAQLVQFLHEAGLIGKPPVIPLTGANLDKADFDEATLAGVELRGVYLRGASLRHANLRGADLRGSDLSGADLRAAYLDKADLRQAILAKAQLAGARLAGVSTEQVDVTGVQPRELQNALTSGTATAEVTDGG